MMKSFLLIIFLFSFRQAAHSQSRLFKKIEWTEGLKIICLTDRFDSLQINKKFTFYCKTQSDVADILKNFAVGNKTRQVGENNEVHIFLLKKKEIQPIQIMINSRLKNINTNVLGDFEYYSFDVAQLVKAHKKYPVDYICKWMVFDTKKNSNDFIAAHKNDEKLLCYEDYTPQYQGEGTITIYKDQLLDNENKGASYINSLLKNIPGNKNDFHISIVSSYDDGIFYYNVECSKIIYDKLVNSRCKRTGWKINKFELLTYWIK